MGGGGRGRSAYRDGTRRETNRDAIGVESIVLVIVELNSRYRIRSTVVDNNIRTVGGGGVRGENIFLNIPK